MHAARCYLIAVFLVILWPILKLAEWMHDVVTRDLKE
jgi:hypothetical protein